MKGIVIGVIVWKGEGCKMILDFLLFLMQTIQNYISLYFIGIFLKPKCNLVQLFFWTAVGTVVEFQILPMFLNISFKASFTANAISAIVFMSSLVAMPSASAW